MSAGGIKTDTIHWERVALPLTAPGTVTTPDPLTASVGSIVEGRIEQVRVLPGDRVARGAPLVHIHSHEMATAERDLATATAQVTFARAAFERSDRLFLAQAISREEVERRRMTYEQARAEEQRSREVVRHLSPSPEGDVVVRAPQAGTVFRVHVRPGEAVVVGAPLVELGDARRLWVTGYIPENAAIHVTRGTAVEVVMGALQDVRLPARVVRIGGEVDSLRRALEVRVELERTPEGIRPGMFASIVLPAADVSLRPVLPADAVQRLPDGEVIFVQEEPGLFRARSTQSTPLSDGRVALDDLPRHLVVAVAGAYSIRAVMQNASPAGS
jgi:RND family efflux transporter MFP subunit